MKPKSKVGTILTLYVFIRDQFIFQSCDLRWVGSAFDGRGATKNDWELLNRISRNLCSSNKKRPRKLRNGKSLNLDSDNRFSVIIN